MGRITPHLWFDAGAAEAARFYVSVFGDARILKESRIEGTPSGTVDIVALQLRGTEFRFISAGPYFKLNPSISFLVACSSAAEVDRLHAALSAGGSDLMPLGEYPFSPRYAWTADRWGVNWQLMLAEGGAPPITPTLMFTGSVCGKAEKAVERWTSLFPGSSVGEALRWAEDEAPNVPGTIKRLGFKLGGQDFAVMDSAWDHGFGFNEAVSFIVDCAGQAEVDKYWDALSAVPEAEQCGWIKDAWGVSWQIVPAVLGELMESPDAAARARVTEAMLGMKKLDAESLSRAARKPV